VGELLLEGRALGKMLAATGLEEGTVELAGIDDGKRTGLAVGGGMGHPTSFTGSFSGVFGH